MRAIDAAGNTALFIVSSVLSVIYWLVLIWVILSWVVFFMGRSRARWKYRGLFDTLYAINEFLTRATAPVLRPIRRLLPPSKTGGIDWSPLILIILIVAIQRFLWLAFGPY